MFTYLRPPLVGVLANGLGMSLLVSLEVRPNEGDLGAIGHARGDGMSRNGIDRHGAVL